VADSDPETPDLAAQFRRDVLTGLSQRQKVVPARWFYDRRGSELFEAITGLPEYYPTRTEIGILESCLGDVAARVGPGRVVVEPGAGSAAKTPLLLDCVAPASYVPVDISGDYLREASAALQQRFPGLAILPVEADASSAGERCGAARFLPRIDHRQHGTGAGDRPAALAAPCAGR